MLTKPILPVDIIALDKSNKQSFPFFISGGDQVVKNEMEIQKQSNSIEVYKQTQETFKFVHTVPANTLTNGTLYQYRIRTYNINNQTSSWSKWQLFYCYSTPSITMDISKIVNNSSVLITGTYTQSENEELQSYQYSLYNENDVLIAASTVKYDELLKHQFSGLTDNNKYKVELKVTTKHKMITTTGKQAFTVEYLKPQIPTVLLLENLKSQGKIKATVNIINIEGSSNDTPVYKNNTYIDLTSNDHKVWFDEGFNLSGDFTLKVWCKGLINNTDFLVLYGDKDTEETPYRITLNYLNNKIHVYEKVQSIDYYIYSEEINLTEEDIVYIYLNRINNLLTIHGEVL